MRKLMNLFRSPTLERDLDRELRYHLDRRVEDLMRSGISEGQAQRQAANEFGGSPPFQSRAMTLSVRLGLATGVTVHLDVAEPGSTTCSILRRPLAPTRLSAL